MLKLAFYQNRKCRLLIISKISLIFNIEGRQVWKMESSVAQKPTLSHFMFVANSFVEGTFKRSPAKALSDSLTAHPPPSPRCSICR